LEDGCRSDVLKHVACKVRDDSIAIEKPQPAALWDFLGNKVFPEREYLEKVRSRVRGEESE
jgi:hypothetical protein